MLRIALSYSFFGIAVVCMAGCGGGASYSTPQEVFDAHQKAAAAKDWKTVLVTMTPESQDATVAGMAFAAVGAAAGNQQINDVLTKHGIRAEQFRMTAADFQGGNLADLTKRMKDKQAQLLAAISDKPQFFADVMEQFESAGQALAKKTGQSSDLAKMNAEATLGSVDINGDTASGKQSVSIAGKKMDLPVQFKKVDGSWLLDVTNLSMTAPTNLASPPGGVKSIPQSALPPRDEPAKSPREDAAIASLTKLGATLTYNFSGRVELVSFTKVRESITDDALAPIKELPTVKDLFLGRTKITDAGMEHLEGLKLVRRILLDRTEVTDAGLAHLKGMTRLQKVDLTLTKVTGAGMADWGKLTDLRDLTLAGTPFNDEGLSHLQHLTSLVNLDLRDTKITDAGLRYLQGNKNLADLNLLGTAITDAACEQIKSFTKMRGLCLKQTAITDAGLAQLGGLTAMKRLDISNTQVTDAGLEYVKAYPNLAILEIRGIKATDAGIAKLQQELPKVRITR